MQIDPGVFTVLLILAIIGFGSFARWTLYQRKLHKTMKRAQTLEDEYYQGLENSLLSHLISY